MKIPKDKFRNLILENSEDLVIESSVQDFNTNTNNFFYENVVFNDEIYKVLVSYKIARDLKSLLPNTLNFIHVGEPRITIYDKNGVELKKLW